MSKLMKTVSVIITFTVVCLIFIILVFVEAKIDIKRERQSLETLKSRIENLKQGESDAYDNGKLAGKININASCNPYLNEETRAAWLKGWIDGYTK